MSVTSRATGVPVSPVSWGSRRPWGRASVLLTDDVNPHGSGRAFDLLHRAVEVVRIQVGHLRLRDLADLVARDPADGLALGCLGALVDARGLAQEVTRRRRLEDERERTVLEHGDLGG